jgi:hypothetical protein
VTSISEISDKETRAFISDLCNNTFLHTVIILTGIPASTPDLPSQALTGIPASTLDLPSQALTTQEIFATNKSKQYNLLRFFGIIIDTSVSTKSTIGYNQYLAYYTIIHQIPINKTTKNTISIKFSIGTTFSISSIEITSQIRKTKFYIVLADTLFLLSIANIDRLKTYLDNTRNILVTPQEEIAVIR